MSDYAQKFQEITSSQSPDQQAKTFLHAFVLEFQGKFEEVLQLCEQFKKAAEGQTGHLRELDEFEAHRFLEKRGATKTVKDLRDELKSIDLDSNNKMCLIEFLLFNYKKTLNDLFTAKPNTALLEKLDRAIEQYQKVLADKTAKENRIAELEAIVKAGGKDAPQARIELYQLKNNNSAQSAKDEQAAIQAKMAAKRALKDPDAEARKAVAEEEARVKEEKERKDREDKEKAAAARARLKEKAAMFGK